MKALITAGVLAAALVGAAGCAEDAGVQNDSDRYTVPEKQPYAAPTVRGQATGVTGQPSGAGGQDMSGEARPGMWDASRSAEVEQPTAAQSSYRNLPPGSTAQPQGAAGTTGTAGTAAGGTTGTTGGAATVQPGGTTPGTVGQPVYPRRVNATPQQEQQMIRQNTAAREGAQQVPGTVSPTPTNAQPNTPPTVPNGGNTAGQVVPGQ